MNIVLIIGIIIAVLSWLIKLFMSYWTMKTNIDIIQSDLSDIKSMCKRIEENTDEIIDVGRENRMHLEDIIKDSNKKKNL